MTHRHPLAGLNLNLFTVFDAVWRRQSVARAAEELGVTSSAVSHALRELRAHVDDPLFVRTRGGMMPTEKAASMHPAIRDALSGMADVLHGGHAFAPAACRHTLTVALSDDIGATLVPAFAAALEAQAPHMRLALRTRGPRALEALEQGDVDLVVKLAADVPGWADAAPLYTDTMVCLLADAPEAWSLAAYLARPHVQVSPEGFGKSSLDAALDAAGHVRRVTMTCASFAMAPELVARTGAVLAAPAAFAAAVAPRLGLHVRPLPIALPAHHVHVYWNRTRATPWRLWAKDTLCAAAAEHAP